MGDGESGIGNRESGIGKISDQDKLDIALPSQSPITYYPLPITYYLFPN
ncbi:MAG: hypothetical protein F6J94_19030 [Moorea sp. SIO1F2]|nr:hypothetical protein [Moorena sp. SIO1F2]NEO42985.1 hypothetical protein [Moorena sp. SIO4A3]NEO62345.1 hypothetical protein [Moorena sp. SIO4G2]NET83938.1 hypothetical protein [Moorena sp. SIO1F2]